MVTLHELEVYNFFAIEHERVVFTDCGFVVVVGPNGAGKTALTIEGPLYAIYGTSFEYGPRPGSSVCSHWAKTWVVKLTFTDQDQTYRIERGSDGLKFFKEGVDISRGKSVDTQGLIEQVIGRSESLFRRSVIFSVNMQRFPDLPESEKKELFDELMGIGVLNNALKQTETVVKALEQEVTVLAALATQAHTQLEREIALERSEKEEKPLIPVVCESELLEERKLLSSTIRELKDRSETDEGKLQKRLLKIRSIKAELSKDIAELTSQIRVLESEVSGLRERETEQETLVANKICPSCKQATDHLEITDFSKDLEDRGRRIAKRREARAVLNSELADGEAMERETDASIRNLRVKSKSELQSLEREFLTVQESLAQLRASQSVVKSREAAITKLRGELAQHDSALAEKRKMLDDEKVLKEIFGQKGCRVAILAGMLPTVNEELMAISEAANSSISLQLTIKDQGESFAGNFAIKVINPRGASQYRGSSAGEKRMLDLFLVFALMRLADKRARTPFNHAFFDETLENLDDVRAGAILAVLKSIAAQKSSVILTAHRAEKITADQLWSVQSGKLTVSE